MNELAVDIRTLSTALAKISSQTSLPRSAFLVEDDFQAEPYNHVATLLTRGDADEARGQAVVAVTGLYTPTGFSFLGVAKSPLSFRTTSPTSSPLNVTTSAFSSTTPSAPTVDRVNIEHDKPADLDLGVARNLKSGIDAESLSSKIILQKIEAEDGRSLEQIFETGSVDLAQHITDIKHILVQYPSMDTTTQLKARVFILTRSIRKIAQRFKNPSKFFTTDSRPWWELLSQCEPELDDPVQFRLDQARATIWEIFVPGTIDATNHLRSRRFRYVGPS
ncbi:hypothetical protein B0H11DRAFT_2248832 [Mycena galericulata]|nr:hypothetical protein B0H11DRAFT_2248832 [Mycena galericulata]